MVEIFYEMLRDFYSFFHDRPILMISLIPVYIFCAAYLIYQVSKNETVKKQHKAKYQVFIKYFTLILFIITSAIFGNFCVKLLTQ